MSNPASVSAAFLGLPSTFSRTTASFLFSPRQVTTTRKRVGDDHDNCPSLHTTRHRINWATFPGEGAPAPDIDGTVSGSPPRGTRGRGLCAARWRLRRACPTRGAVPSSPLFPASDPHGENRLLLPFPTVSTAALASPLPPALRQPQGPAPCPEQAELPEGSPGLPASPAACFRRHQVVHCKDPARASMTAGNF